MPTACRLLRTPIDSSVTVADLLPTLAGLPDVALLESTGRDEAFGRYSILGCCPLRVLELRNRTLFDEAGTTLAEGPEAIWAALTDEVESFRLAEPAECAYLPGWIGYVGYEVGRLLEALPGRAPRDTSLPDLRWALYDALLVRDESLGRWELLELDFETPPPGAGRAAILLREVLAGQYPPAKPATTPAPAGQPTSNFTPDAYRHAVERAVQYIAAGDIFQVNLSQRFEISPAADPATLYRILRKTNPAAYAALLPFEAEGRPCGVVSSSPELFLRCRNGQVVTRPIKGTRRRTGDPAHDTAAQEDLLASPKDNAELAMIVDLLRNDLGRVCQFGSVRVSESRCLETHPTVFHLVGTVVGTLQPDIGPIDLLRATFPGGSITGAPKIRAMEIIDELEPVARGVYTGCIGWISVDGSCEWNIAIRTILCDGPRAFVQAGGGIVADSTPQAELDETCDKARALLDAIAQAGSGVPSGPQMS